MYKKLGLGTLSLSGAYQRKTTLKIEREVEKIDSTYFQFIDFAYVYKELGLDVLNILANYKNWRKKTINFKFARDLSKNNEDIFNEIIKSVPKNWEGDLFLMFHRVTNNSYKRHLEIISYLKKRSFDYDLSFGLSLHSIEQYKDYISSDIFSKIQIPYNIVDNKAMDKLIKICSNNKKIIQARSLLGGGLFTGKFDYSDFGKFEEGIRSGWNIQNKSFVKRIRKFEEIIKENNFYSDKKLNFDEISLYMYDYVLKNKYIEEIISGGSNHKQINLLGEFIKNLV